MAVVAAESPLLSPTLFLDVEEHGGEKARLHVSGAVLQKMPYFAARLSERWREGGQGLGLRLPEGCTSAALMLLFERLHFPSGQLGGLDMDVALQVVQLATMLLAERDALLDELKQLLLDATRTSSDIDKLQAFCHRVDPPKCMAEIAVRLQQRSILSVRCAEQLPQLLQSALLQGSDAAFEIVERTMKQALSCGALAGESIAESVRGLLRKGVAQKAPTESNEGFLTFHEKARYSSNRYDEVPNKGLSKMLALATRLVFACPEHFSALAPLMFPRLAAAVNVVSSTEVEKLLEKTLQGLLDGCFADDSGEFSAADLQSLWLVLVKHGHMSLLKGRTTLQLDTRSSCLTRFVQRAPVHVKEGVCDMLCKGSPAVVASIVTCDMLSSLPDSHRQQLCSHVLVQIDCLHADTQAAVLAEVRSQLAAGDKESFALQPKKQRRR